VSRSLKERNDLVCVAIPQLGSSILAIETESSLPPQSPWIATAAKANEGYHVTPYSKQQTAIKYNPTLTINYKWLKISANLGPQKNPIKQITAMYRKKKQRKARNSTRASAAASKLNETNKVSFSLVLFYQRH